jgi:hypothetical protein
VTTVALITQSSTSSWLELGSQFCGIPKSIDGGDVTADVVTEPPGPDGIAHKHIGNVKYEDIVLAFGADMSPSVYDWIAATLSRTYSRKSGAIVTGDVKAVSRLEFTDALLHEITFPALDASSKDSGAIEIKLTPENTRTATPGGSISAIKSTDSLSKKWLVQNFRLQIDGLDVTRVDAIDALTINSDLVSNLVGAARDYQTESAGLNIPNVCFTIPESAAASLTAWHEDFVIKRSDAKKNGSLQFLAANSQDVLFTLTFHNLGIIKLKKVATDLGSIPRLRAEMFCEEIGFQYKGATTTSSGTSNGSAAATQNFSRPPLRGDYAIAGPIAGQTQPSPLPVGNAPNLGWPLRFRG